MDSCIARLNGVSCTFVICVALAALGNHFSSYCFSSRVDVFLKATEIYEMTINHYLQGDQVNLAFDLQTNLRSAFNWNTKQLFVYVIALYKTAKNPRNEVMLWDDIWSSSESSVVKLENQLNKYPFRDHQRMLRDRNITLALKYRYMPVVGTMREVETSQSFFETPKEYFRYTGGRRRSSSENSQEQ